MISHNIREEATAAMKARNKLKVRVLRGLLAAFTNEVISQKKKPDAEISDDDALKVIKRAVKQREDSIEQFAKGGRNDLVENEQAELEILKTYLPEVMSKEEIQKVAEAKKTEMGIEDKTKMGILMGAVMKELGGKADGKDVKEVVDNLFA